MNWEHPHQMQKTAWGKILFGGLLAGTGAVGVSQLLDFLKTMKKRTPDQTSEIIVPKSEDYLRGQYGE